MLLQNCLRRHIREAASRNGMKSFSDDGWRLVRLGVTTPEEVMRVTKDQTLDAATRSCRAGKPDIDVVSRIRSQAENGG